MPNILHNKKKSTVLNIDKQQQQQQQSHEQTQGSFSSSVVFDNVNISQLLPYGDDEVEEEEEDASSISNNLHKSKVSYPSKSVATNTNIIYNTGGRLRFV